jgi:hypothetical protein
LTERHLEYRRRLGSGGRKLDLLRADDRLANLPERGCTGVKAIGIKEIEKIFAVTEALGLSREAVVIPLRTATPGTLRILSSRKLEIVVDGGLGFEQWLSGLEGEIRRLMNLEAD